MAGYWLPNPYALAQILTNELDLESLYNADGQSVDQFLIRAFQSGGKDITLADALGLLQQLAEAVKGPMKTAEVMDLAQAKRAVDRFGLEAIQVLLPYLVPLSDAVFARSPSGESSQASGWFADSGQLMIDDTSYLDPIQGAVGDCYLIASMIALAWAQPKRLKTHMRSTGFNPPAQRIFQWQFHGEPGSELNTVKVSGRIPVAGKTTPRYAKSISGESWPGLLEKAFVVRARSDRPTNAEPTPADYQLIDRKGTPHAACRSLMGGSPEGHVLELEDGKKIFTEEGKLGTRSGAQLASGAMSKPVMAWTKKDIGVKDSKVWEKTGLWPSHAYAVLGVMGGSNRVEHIVIRNPHGVATDTETREGYAKGVWNAGERSVKLNQHGVFAITTELFYKHFGDIGWVNIDSP